MKLNPECVRAILLTVEEEIKSPYEELVISPDSADEYKRLKPFTSNEVLYHLRQCIQAGLINCPEMDLSGNYYVQDLTPAGHEFLANIRENSLWKRVMEKAASASLPVILEVAKAVAHQHFIG